MTDPKLHDYTLVHQEYADPSRLETRFRVFREFYEGDPLEPSILEAVVEGPHAEVLEVGCGAGSFSVLLGERTDAHVQALDLSPAMVAIARSRGVRAHVGDVSYMAYEDDSLDVVVANWMLYHLPDLDAGLEEIKRVLRPGGRLIATTLGPGTNGELWAMLPEDGSTPRLSFTTDTGAEILLRHFPPPVERRDLHGRITFPGHAEAVEYVRSTITRGHLAERVPYFEGPLCTTSFNSVFIATKPTGGDA
jgi:SAM-dependent methyltransferase